MGKNLPALQLEIDQLKQKLVLSVKECDLARQDKEACVEKSKNLEKELSSWLNELEQVCADSKESEQKSRKQQVYIQELKAELNALRQNMDLMVQDKLSSLVISAQSNSLEKQYSIEEQKQEVCLQELKELNEWRENKHLKDFILQDKESLVISLKQEKEKFESDLVQCQHDLAQAISDGLRR